MDILNIDVGLKSYQLVEGGELLTFNPSDPNVYARYLTALDRIKAVQKKIEQKAKTLTGTEMEQGQKMLALLQEADRKFKDALDEAFGEENNFDKILRGVNLTAPTASGKSVIENVVEALTPIVQSGVDTYVNKAIDAEKLNREQRRALQK